MENPEEAGWEDDPGSGDDDMGVDEAMNEGTLRYISTLRLISHGIQATPNNFSTLTLPTFSLTCTWEAGRLAAVVRLTVTALLGRWYRSASQARRRDGAARGAPTVGGAKPEPIENLTSEETRVLREFLWKCNLGGHTVETAGTQLGWLNSALYATQQRLIEAPRGDKERGKLKRRVEALDTACRQAHQARTFFSPCA